MDIESIYRKAGRELRTMLLGIDLSSFNAEKAEVIRRKTRAIVTALNVLVVQWARTAIPKEVRKASSRARTVLEILGKKPRRPDITAPGYEVEEQVIKVFFNANLSIKETVDKYLSVVLVASHKLRATQVQEFSYQEASEDLDEIALEALTTEQSRGWLSKQMSDYLRTNLIAKDEFINIKGRMYRLSKYSQLVARTELRNAQSRATLDLCKQYDNDLVQVSSHGTDCNICSEYEGQIYSISGRHTRYPILSDSPPYHPNCMHSILPTSEEAIEIREARK